MRAGRLNKRVTIQQVSVTKDSANQPIETFSTLDTVWADFEEMSGTEKFENDRLSTEYRVKVTMRARSDVTTAMRVVYRSETYHIESVSPYDPRRDTVIIANAAS